MMKKEIDEIDKHIIYKLSKNSRKTTAPEIAKEVDVSPGTIRNRVKRLEKRGIIQEYTISIDFEKLNEGLVILFKCQSPSVKQKTILAKKTLKMNQVINVRELLTGKDELHIKAVGKNTKEINQIAKELENLGLEIVDQNLLGKEHNSPYNFSKEEVTQENVLSQRKTRSGAEIIDVSIREGSSLSGKTIQETKKQDILPDNVLVISLERDGKRKTPTGKTELKHGDIISLFSATGLRKEIFSKI